MQVITQLATSLNRRDEQPNTALAKTVAAAKDKKAVKELVENLHNKNKNIQNDCIKVLYEIGAINPSLISPYVNDFLALLNSSNNRMQWGGMTALNYITNENAQLIYEALPKLSAIAAAGSVITKDSYVAILIKLCTHKVYSNHALDLLNEHLKISLPNQLPMYAENALPVIAEKYKTVFIKTLTARLPDMEKETKRKRVEKIIKKLTP